MGTFDAGNYGTLSYTHTDFTGLDVDTLGQLFITVEKPPEKEVEVVNIERTPPPPTPAPANVVDWPPELAAEASAAILANIDTLRDYLVKEVVPLVLCTDASLSATLQVVSSMFNIPEDETPASLPRDKLNMYSAQLGLVMTQVKLIQMSKLPEPVQAALISRITSPKDVK